MNKALQKKEYTREEVNQANIVYHNALACSYDERLDLFHERVGRVYKKILNRYVFPKFAQASEIEVLDVACGTGCLEHFLIRDNVKITAFDISEGMINIAKKTFPNIDFKVGDAYNMPIESGRQFDIVCENGALHHIRDYFDVLNGMAERVRSGGVLYIGCEPNSLGFKAFSWCRNLYRKFAFEDRVKDITNQMGDEVEKVSEYHQFFTMGLKPKEIDSFLQQRGFEPASIFYVSEHFVAQLNDRLGWKVLDWIPEWVLRCIGPLSLNFHMVAVKK